MTMTAADKIHALADTGTPGPLTEMCLGSEGYVVVEATPTAIGRRRRRAASCRYEDFDTCKADAAKIVAFVNAGHHIANLIDVLDRLTHLSGEFVRIDEWTRDMAAARDALVQALGVTA